MSNYKTVLVLLPMLLLFGLVPISIHAQSIDILIKNGHVIDPKNGIDEVMDVAISDGRILQVQRNIPSNQARRVVDASGLYVTPGVIDMHTHVFYGTRDVGFRGFEITDSYGSVVPDDFTFRAGVTTVVDAGSSGWRDFHRFRKQTVENSQTRVLAFISIVGHGMTGSLHAQDVSDMNPLLTSYVINEHSDIIVGIKVHHYTGSDFIPVQRGVEAGEMTNRPVMVDFGGTNPPLSLEELFFNYLRPGDIFTHTYAYSLPRRESVVDENNRVKPFVFEAQKRGIVFDIGHGAGAFVWHVAINSMQQGFRPDVISTDLYRNSRNAGMKDMSNVMSKFLNMGMSVQDIILRTTWNPAQVIQRPELGNLDVGAVADVAVYRIREGEFGFLDARGNRMNGNRKLEAELTIRAGHVVWDLNGISARIWNEH